MSKKHFKEHLSKDIIVDLIVEEYRFLRSCLSMMSKLMPDDMQKYQSTYRFHVEKIQEIVAKSNLKIVDLEGKKFDEGLSINPLNIEDFGKNDTLIIKQMIEPLIISTTNGSIVKSGTAILEKVEGEN